MITGARINDNNANSVVDNAGIHDDDDDDKGNDDVATTKTEFQKVDARKSTNNDNEELQKR